MERQAEAASHCLALLDGLDASGHGGGERLQGVVLGIGQAEVDALLALSLAALAGPQRA
ncbi:hypothetical protein ACFQYP_19110 [Nonomuraea antimicrobica]